MDESSPRSQSAMVDAWLLPVAAADGDLERIAAPFLDPWERGRMTAFRLAGDRTRFAAAHLLVRWALSSFAPTLGAAAPSAWRLEQAASGKPLVAAPAAGRALHFSLSHTDGLVGCVVAEAPVGLDIERIDERVDVEKLLRHTMSPAERAHWERGPHASGAARFLRHWTLKEAAAKALGDGLTQSLARFAFAPDAPDGPRPLEGSELAAHADEWQFWQRDWRATHLAAVALFHPGAAPPSPIAWRDVPMTELRRFFA